MGPTHMFRWLTGRGATQRQVARELARISPQAWQTTIDRYPFLAGLSQRENDALRQRAAWLLASKTFVGVQGLEVTDEIMLSIAVQAALPILELDPVLYEGWIEIVLYPGGFLVPRSDVDESGVVHEYIEATAGEAWDGGPIILSWEDSGHRMSQKTNLVIHEFAHKLDMHHGEADGMPSLAVHADLSPRQWRHVLNVSFKRFNAQLRAVEDAIPRHVDPESDDAAPWFDTLPMDPYAATNTAEFFAVSSEVFFVNPEPLARILPEWYGLLSRYYRQDPLRRLAGNASM